MLFTSLDFIVFLTVVLAVYWSLNSINKQNYFLLAGSLFFYGYADWKFLSLIIACALTGYIFAVTKHMDFYKPLPEWNFLKWNREQMLDAWDHILKPLDPQPRNYLEPGV